VDVESEGVAVVVVEVEAAWRAHEDVGAMDRSLNVCGGDVHLML